MSQILPQQALAACDAELTRLETACAASTSNLLDLDSDPVKTQLAQGPLTGTTKAQWAVASDALASLWENFGLLTKRCQEARALRGTKRQLSNETLSAFHDLVLGKNIVLSTALVPLAQRSLSGAASVTNACTPAELLADMERSFAEATAVLAQAARGWNELLTRAGQAQSDLNAAGSTPEAVAAQHDLDVFTSTLTTDPIGADERLLARAEDGLRRAQQAALAQHRLAEQAGSSVAAARALFQVLGAAHADACDAVSLRGEKISGAFTTDVPDFAPLGRELAGLAQLAQSSSYTACVQRCQEWTSRAQHLLDALISLAAQAKAPLEERSELRGRLDAYKAKALRHGVAEDPELTQLLAAAEQVLYNAPTDLTAARAAVEAYLTCLNGPRSQ